MSGREANSFWSFAFSLDPIASFGTDTFASMDAWNLTFIGAFAFLGVLCLLLMFFQRFEKKSLFSLGLFFGACGALSFYEVVGLPETEPEIFRGLQGLAVGLGFAVVRFLWAGFHQRTAYEVIESEPTHQKIDLLLAGSGVGIYEWYDLRDMQKTIYWSDRMFELLGFKPQSFEPTIEFYFSLIHPEDRDRIRQSIYDHIENGSLEPVEYRIRVLSEYRWFRSRRFVEMDERGEPQFIVGSIENIHEQKIAEEKIRSLNSTLEEEVSKRTMQLEQVNLAKTRFLSNMSHEMRTPLGLVLGFAELLAENPNIPPETQSYVQTIMKNGAILSRIINDLLDLTKIEAGQLRFQYSKIKLRSLVEDFEQAFAEDMSEKNIQFTIQNLCADDETVVTDEIRLKQIVYNLLSNAIEFTDTGSIHLTLGKRDRTYYIDVVDTGVGIPEQEKETVFNEFARKKISDATAARGTGLGLHLAQSLAQALGGDVELVSSQMSKGSHFRMTFQSDESKLQRQVERRRDEVVSSRLSSFEIFVLDDNADNIRLAEIFLKKLGCRVRGFTSAKSLFAEMVSQSPDLILLDIHMPEMNGFEVFDHLRKMGYKQPIWALTAYSLNEDIQAILAHGFDDFIRKPIGIESMKKKLTLELRERMND